MTPKEMKNILASFAYLDAKQKANDREAAKLYFLLGAVVAVCCATAIFIIGNGISPQ